MAPVYGHRHSTRMRRKYTQEQRSQLIELVANGTKVPEAARRMGVGVSAAYSWVADSRKAKGPHPVGRRKLAFARLVPSATVDTSIVVRVAGAEVQVRRGFDGELLRAVVATLSETPR
jgi:transposase-like protein